MSTHPAPKELQALAESCGIGWAAGLGGMDDFLRDFARAVLAKWGTPTAGEPIGWEWRWKDTSPHTVTSGQWSEWKRVEARSRLSTVEDAVREFQHYIAGGAAYELRQLYTSPQPVREPLTPEQIELAAIRAVHTFKTIKNVVPFGTELLPYVKSVLTELQISTDHGIKGGSDADT